MNVAFLLGLAQHVPHREIRCGAALKKQTVLEGHQAPSEIIVRLGHSTNAIQSIDTVQWRLLAILGLLNCSADAARMLVLTNHHCCWEWSKVQGGNWITCFNPGTKGKGDNPKKKNNTTIELPSHHPGDDIAIFLVHQDLLVHPQASLKPSNADFINIGAADLEGAVIPKLVQGSAVKRFPQRSLFPKLVFHDLLDLLHGASDKCLVLHDDGAADVDSPKIQLVCCWKTFKLNLNREHHFAPMGQFRSRRSSFDSVSHREEQCSFTFFRRNSVQFSELQVSSRDILAGQSHDDPGLNWLKFGVTLVMETFGKHTLLRHLLWNNFDKGMT